MPCGRCVGCRVDRSREWAVRCYHEAQLHGQNSFITLTYNDDHLPWDRSLSLRDWQLFMKRLRKEIGQVRFFHCGEYGEKTNRPHYHACLFGFDFPDKVIWKVKNNVPIYKSAMLERIWGKGFCTVGAVTFESAAYVARYIMKKVTGDLAADHYAMIDPETGEILAYARPEYTTMSRNPGIAKGWLEKYGVNEVYPDDFVVVGNRRMKVPKFYDRHFELTEPETFESVKKKRADYAARNAENNTPERLAARKKVFVSRISKLKRNLDEES